MHVNRIGLFVSFFQGLFLLALESITVILYCTTLIKKFKPMFQKSYSVFCDGYSANSPI